MKRNRYISNIAGAVLAGGKNTRMQGKDKAFVEIKGVPFISRILEVYKSLFSEIIIVTNCPKQYQEYRRNYTIVSDSFPNRGPLGGIHAGVSVALKKNVFFVACDMPYLHIELIEKQILEFKKVNCQAFVPRVKAKLEPLHAIYSVEIKQKLEDYLLISGNYAVSNFLKKINTCYWDLPDKYLSNFTNVNTPQELKEIHESKG